MKKGTTRRIIPTWGPPHPPPLHMWEAHFFGVKNVMNKVAYEDGMMGAFIMHIVVKVNV